MSGGRTPKTFKSLETLSLPLPSTSCIPTTGVSRSDALYNSSGSSIAVSKKGIAGDCRTGAGTSFVTYTHGPIPLGAGFGHFFKGEFIS